MGCFAVFVKNTRKIRLSTIWAYKFVQSVTVLFESFAAVCDKNWFNLCSFVSLEVHSIFHTTVVSPVIPVFITTAIINRFISIEDSRISSERLSEWWIHQFLRARVANSQQQQMSRSTYCRILSPPQPSGGGAFTIRCPIHSIHWSSELRKPWIEPPALSLRPTPRFLKTAARFHCARSGTGNGFKTPYKPPPLTARPPSSTG